MKQIKIEGGKTLSGTIRISGAKNAAVALIPAAILTDGEVTLCNIPEISDIDSLEEILKYLNVSVKRNTEAMVINSKGMENKEIPECIAKKLRASYYFMGALLAKYKKVSMYFPGGCNIGKRPIDIHLEGFKKLGATVTATDDKYEITAERLIGTNLNLPVPSVGATINLMIAATKAEGVTVIKNAAKEPEIINVAELLNSMGAKITGAGTDTIKITGVDELSNGYSLVIPDRIEAGTYVIVGSLLGNNLKIDNIIPEHLKTLTEKLIESGANLIIEQESITCMPSDNLKKNDIVTYYYPGFPTDLQQPFSVFLTKCEGVSTIEESIWENRFMHVPYLNKMGAKIKVADKKAIISGPTNLSGSSVVATDLRGGAAMVIAGLIAEGVTTVNEVEHILRGYDGIIDKLTNVGAKIELEEVE